MSKIKDIIGRESGNFPSTQEEIKALLEYSNRLRLRVSDQERRGYKI